MRFKKEVVIGGFHGRNAENLTSALVEQAVEDDSPQYLGEVESYSTKW